MPNKYTFSIKPIAELISRYVTTGNNWIDPFAGKYSPAEYTNDLNKKERAQYHMHAELFAGIFVNKTAAGVLFDPPYSTRQIKEVYNSIGIDKLNKKESQCAFNYLKPIYAEKIKKNGLAICCGWNSLGFGKTLGFKMLEILLVPHGGAHNDTIVTVEQKIN